MSPALLRWLLCAFIARLRRDIPPLARDRILSGDIDKAARLIANHAIVRATGHDPLIDWGAA